MTAAPLSDANAPNQMLRADALAAIYPDLIQDDVLVVTIMGAVAVELYSLGHRHSFFYLEHAMGLASSMGLGLALSLPRCRVVVIDGDGSLLMNLGTLSTLARYRPGNLTHLVFDNESLLSVGGFPTATSTGTDLAGIARASGIPAVVTADTVDDVRAAVGAALVSTELTTIVAKVAAIGPTSFHMDLPLLENRFQFRRHIQTMTGRESAEAAADNDLVDDTETELILAESAQA
jgi:sulfopyruvate decarboxylase subunit beta